jgi:hypothetical protein
MRIIYNISEKKNTLQYKQEVQGSTNCILSFDKTRETWKKKKIVRKTQTDGQREINTQTDGYTDR